MTFRRVLSACAVALPMVCLVAAARFDLHAAPDTTQVAHERPISELAPAPWADADPADSLYRVAREALSKNEFTRAASLFADIVKRYPQSAYAGDALYYRAFALYRVGGDTELRDALKSLDSQRSKFPKAKTAGDADELRVRIQGTLARHGDASSAAVVSRTASDTTSCARGAIRDDDESDVRVAAMNALLQMDSESALPIIKQVLQKRDACSVSLRKKAVFMLSQKRSGETETLLSDVIHNDPSSDVRVDAVFWMGQVNTDRAASMLETIATTSPDMDMREKALFALTQQRSGRGQALIRRLAESSDTPERVRSQAIFFLGQARSADNADFLRSLFGKLGKGDQNVETRKNVLFSLSQMRGFGNDHWLIGVAQDASQGIEVRKHALFCAGQAGVPASDMIALYDHTIDADMKEQIIWVLSESRDRSATDKVFDIAAHDKDIEMRKKALFWLGQKNDPRVKQLIMDILKG